MLKRKPNRIKDIIDQGLPIDKGGVFNKKPNRTRWLLLSVLFMLVLTGIGAYFLMYKKTIVMFYPSYTNL